MSKPRPSDPESGTERVCGIVALLFYTLLLVGGLGITVIVASTSIEPRPAAMLMIAPSLLIWALASTRRSFRRTALMFFPPYL